MSDGMDPQRELEDLEPIDDLDSLDVDDLEAIDPEPKPVAKREPAELIVDDLEPVAELEAHDDLEPVTELEAHDDLEPVDAQAASKGEQILDDLPDLEEVADLGDDVPGAAPAPAKGARTKGAAEGEPAAEPLPDGSTGPRELEKAPLMLRKAALVLFVSALFPWLVPGGWFVPTILAKLVVLAGGYFLYAAVLHNHGEKVPGAFAKLGGLHKMALPGLGWIVMLAGVLPLIDAGGSALTSMVEKAAIAVGIACWCQILDYEKGGKFNPMLGLVIPVFGLAALGRFGLLLKEFEIFAMIGDVGVIAASGLAAYTMFVAIKDAKAHGQAKKLAAMEARKAARKAGGPGKRSR